MLQSAQFTKLSVMEKQHMEARHVNNVSLCGLWKAVGQKWLAGCINCPTAVKTVRSINIGSSGKVYVSET